MTHVADFTQDSAYPGKKLMYDPDRNQLQVEGYGPVTVDRIRELDHVGQVQWVNESLRKLAYSIDQPPAQPTPAPAPAPAPQPRQTPPPPPRSSGASPVITFVIALIAIVAIVAIAFGLFNLLSETASDDTAEPPATTEPAEPVEPSSDTTS
jgi:hypothetical protein